MTSVLVAVALPLLLVSAVLSAAETAVLAVGSSRVRTLVEEGFRGAEHLARARARAGSIQAAVLLADGLVNLAAAGLLVGAAVLARGAAGLVWAVPATAVLILAVGELFPRAAAGRRPVRLALLAAPVLLRIEAAAQPLLAPFGRLEELLARRNGDETETAAEREVRELTALGQREGIVGEEEHLLVERAFRLDELTAWDAMTPRVDIFAWRDSLTLEEIVGELDDVPYSRVPVYGDSIDDVTGILYVREAYRTYVAGHRETPLAQVSREPFFVPGSLPLTRLLRDFQARRIHMGIVADEFGGTDGLITLEDVLEELVGEIVDETDVDEEEPLVRLSRNEIIADGGVDLREINYAFNVSLPQLEHRSLNGYVLEELGYVPRPGETLERAGISIEIVEATETQVVRARLRKLQTAGGGEAA